MSKKTITIINFGYIGDVLNISPITKALAIKYPEHNIVVITSPGSVQTAKMLPGVTDSVGFARYDEHKGLRMFKFALDFMRSFKTDIAIILTENFRAALLGFLIGAKQRLGRSCEGRDFLLTKRIPFTQEEKELQIHVTEQYAKVLTLLGIDKIDLGLEFNCKDNDVEYVRNIIIQHNFQGKKLLGICPSTGANGQLTKEKCWNTTQFVKFIQTINQEGIYIPVIVGQEACATYVKELVKNGETDFIDLTNKTSIPQLAAAISLFDKFVSIDSAPMHMGFAVKTPTLGLFFQENFKKWGPYDKIKNSMIFNRFITAEDVIAKLKSLEG